MRSFWALLVLGAVACQVDHNAPRGRARDVVITAVPLLTKEMAATYPFLQQDFAANGMLAGKEVYAFVPSTVVVAEGDTLRLQLVNPEDDEHTFVLPDLFLRLAPQSTSRATWVARRAGVYPFYCVIPQHMPMMWGQIVVLARGGAGPQ